MKKDKLEKIVILLLLIVILCIGFYSKIEQENVVTNNQISYETSDIPNYNGEIYVLINNNIPKFSEDDMQINEYYSNLENGKVRNGYDKN